MVAKTSKIISGRQLFITLRVIGIFLGIGFLIYQIFSSLLGFNWSSLSLRQLPSILLALVFNILAIILQMLAWKMILGSVGQRISLIDVFSGFSLSFVARYIPGTVWGYLARGEWLKRDHDIPYATTNLCSIIETIGLVVANLLVILQGFLLNGRVQLTVILLIAFFIGSWALINLVISWKPTRRLFRLEDKSLMRLPLPKWSAILVLFLLMWYCYGLSLIFFARGIEPQLTFSSIFIFSSSYSLAWFLGFIVLFLPSGLGLREYSLTLLLMAQFGVLKANASFIAIGFRVLISIAELLWIGFGLARKSLIHLGKK